MLELFLQLED